MSRSNSLPVLSRRSFLQTASLAAVAVPFASAKVWATPLNLPLGVQLYSVREQMMQDLDMALAGVKAAGFVEVEAAALPKKSAKEVRASLDKAGLRCVSAHHPFNDLQAGFEDIVAYDRELGCKFMICSSPGRRTRHATGGGNAHGLTLDDWRFNAEQFNSMGEKTAASGIQFGYHNHTPEFTKTDGEVPYYELLRLTDPKKVTMELDCGWAMVAGVNPVDLMRKFPHRFSMFHVKDFKLPSTPNPSVHDAKVTELGVGSIDYRPIFAEAAKSQHIQHAFVEQEAFDMPWQQSLKVDAEYLRNFKG